MKSIEIEKKEKRFNYIIRFLTVGSLFNGSIYICKVFNIQDNSIILNDISEPNII